MIIIICHLLLIESNITFVYKKNAKNVVYNLCQREMHLVDVSFKKVNLQMMSEIKQFYDSRNFFTKCTDNWINTFVMYI